MLRFMKFCFRRSLKGGWKNFWKNLIKLDLFLRRENGGLNEEVLIRREIEEIVQLNCAD